MWSAIVNRNTAKTPKGFTLIELLVVIAIIALLLSVLVPSLNKVKDIAKKIGCSANLRSLSMAAILYADASDGCTPSSTNTWDDNGTLRAGWSGVTNDNFGKSFSRHVQIYGNDKDEYTGLQKGQLWSYIENSEAWRCPTDPDIDQLRSYCMAGQWWGRNTTADKSIWYDPGPKTYKKIIDIEVPSEKFLFVDQIGLNLDAYFAIWHSQKMWWNIPQFNHEGGSVNGFADGHVESRKLGSETVKMATEGLDKMLDGYKMPQRAPVTDKGIEDLMDYQIATWGASGW
jgi:prepilin-type N-terminal cleavage/methylation domain-containing protein